MPPSAGTGPAAGVERGPKVGLEAVFEHEATDFLTEFCNRFLLGTVNRIDQFRPLDNHNTLPEFRRNGVRQMMTLADGQVGQPSASILRLPYVSEASSDNMDSVNDGARHLSTIGRFGQQFTDLMREPVSPVLPFDQSVLCFSQHF